MAAPKTIAKSATAVSLERIAAKIYVVRGEQVMLDSALAALYGVTTTALNQQVKRNSDRFPADFAFQLPPEENANLMSQFVTSSSGYGGRRKPPRVFTEQGVAMLSSVLRSERAAEVNVAIMPAFVKLRRILASDQALARKVAEHDRQIASLIDIVQRYLAPPEPAKKGRIGFL